MYTSLRLLLFMVCLIFLNSNKLYSQRDISLVNGGFESPYINKPMSAPFLNASSVPGWQTTAIDNIIEIWCLGGVSYEPVYSQEGRQHAELNANYVSTLYQVLNTESGKKMRWSLYHRGRRGVDKMQLRIGSSLYSYSVVDQMSTGLAWKLYKGSYTVPQNQTQSFFMFSSISAAGGDNSIGNFLDDVRFSYTSELILEKSASSTVVTNGDVVTITTIVKNIGGTSTEQTLVTDKIPGGTAYQVGSLVVNGVAQTDINDNDKAYIAGSNLYYKLDKIVKGGTAVISFKVKILNCQNLVTSTEALATYYDEFFTDEQYTSKSNQLTIQPKTKAINLEIIYPFCPNGSATLNIGSQPKDYIIIWTLPDGSIMYGKSTSIIANESGIYKVLVKSPQNCESSVSKQVIIQKGLVVDLGTDRSICKGSTTTLDAGNPGSTYLWNTGATTQTLEVTQAGTYSVVVTDPNGCQGSDEIKISINPELSVDLGTDRSICKGSTTTLDAGNPGSTYLWNTGATTRTLEVTQAGTYSVVVTDPNGCQGSDEIKISINPELSVDLGTDRSICKGSTTTLDAGNPGSTYLWNTGATTRTLEVTQAGTYSVVVTDPNGCQGSDEIKISINPELSVDLGTDRSICKGSTTTLDAGNPGSTYLWNTGATTRTLEVTQAGTYSVVVTDPNGCQGSDEIKISINPELSVDLGTDRSICKGSTTTLDAGNPGSTYLWNTGATTRTLEVTQAGTYSVVVTDPNGCQGSDEIKISINPELSVDLGTDRSICKGSTTTLDAGNPGSTYLWNTGATTRTLEVTQAGTYSVVVTDPNGCQGSDEIKISINPQLSVDLGTDRSICKGSTTTLDAGNPGSTYLWNTGATTRTLEVTQAGTYSVVVTDPNGCQGSDEIKISINPELSVDLGTDRSICKGSTTTLDAGNPGSTYLWNTGATTRTLEVTQAGTYSVVVTDPNGCQGSDEIKISINPELSVDLGTDRSICKGSTTTLDAGNPGSTYLWNTGATTRTLEVTQAGTYSVVVTDPNGCQGSDEIKISINPELSVDLGTDRSICKGSTTTLDAGNPGSTYLWNTGATTRTLEVTQAGTYSVVVTDPNGCQGSDEIKISINPELSVDLGTDRSICKGSTTTLDAGNPGSTYLWNTGATTRTLEVTQAGTYSVVVTDPNGCQGSDEIKISINPELSVDLGTDRSICKGSTTTLDAGNPGSTYLWNTGATTRTLEVTQAGTYSVVVTDPNGCQGSDEIKISINPELSVDLGTDRSICKGSTTTLDAGNPGSTYLWNTGATTQTLEVTQAGTYSVVVTDPNGCQGSDEIKISINPELSVDLGTDRSICKGSTTTLDAGNPGSTYLWNTGATTRTLEVTQAGTYSVVVTDPNGCQGSDEIKISINPQLSVDLGTDRSICKGSTTTLDAGNPGSTYLWNTGATTRTLEVTQAGTYSVVVTDPNGCQGSDEIKISINPQLSVDLGTDRSICKGSTTTLDAGNPGSTYLWNTGATTQTLEVTQAGTYSVVVTDPNGCQGSDEIKIIVNVLPEVDLGTDRSICKGSTTTLDAGNPGSTYLWNTGATTRTLEVTQAGTYSVVVTDPNGCQGSDEIKISINPELSVDLGTDRSICKGSTTTLDAGNPGSTYLWNTGATTRTLEVTQAGTYSVVVTDPNGCQGSDEIKISINPELSVDLGTDRSICKGSTTTLDAGNPGSTYLWNTGATTRTLEVTQAGTYSVVVTDPNGCQGSDEIKISINPELSVDLGTDRSICKGSTTTLDAGNPGSTYLWNTGATTRTLEVTQAGTYSVVVTDPNGCQGSDEIKISINPELSVDLGTDRSICKGSTTTLDAGNPGSTYLWNTGATTRTLEVTQAGTYSVVVTDPNGCQGSDEIKISINPELSVDLGTDRSICKGSTTTLDAGNPGSTYLWNTGATTRTLEVTQAGTYSVVVTDPNGCQGSDEIKISINPELSVDLGTDRSICKGSTTTLDAGNPGSTYLWNTGATTRTLEVTQAGTYSVVVTDPNGCQGSDEIKISINPELSVDLGTDRSICKGSTTTLDAGNPGSTYLWNTGATTRTLEVTQAGTYSVVVTDPNGCQGSDEIKISINPELSVDLGTDRSICKGSTTTLDAGNPGSTYLWNTGATTRTLEVTQAGTYSVVVTDPNGCQGSDEIKISINPELSVDLGTDRSICKGSTTTLDAGNPGSTYLWNTGATTRTLEVTQAGTYSVVVTDPNGCQGSDEIKISINPELSVDLGTDRSICKGSTTTLDAGNPGSTYLWNTGATTRTLEVTQAGTYSVVVTDPNGCQGSDEIKISINPQLSVDLGTDRSICKGSTTTLDAGNPGSTYLWNTGATTRTLEVTQAGTYSVVVTDPNGCQGSDEIKISINPQLSVDLGTDRSICKGSTTTLDAGNPGSTYLWNTGATTQTLEVTQAGTYSVVVTDPNGCQGSDEIKIIVNVLPEVDLGTDRSICKGSTTTLDAGNPGSTYLWNTGATTRTLEVTQAGTYSVVVTDPNGCQGSDEIKISINPELSVDLGTDRSICKGSTTTLDAGNPGSTYLWNTGATTQTLEVTQAGTYSVVVTDPNGCQGSDEIKISINPELSVDLGTDRSICKGSTTTLDAGNPGSTYLWNTGATTRTLEVTQAGTYSVVVTDPNGCQGSDEIKISINPELSVDLGTDRSICKGSTTTLDAGNPGSTYLWNTGATTRTLEVTQAGTYSVVVTDPNGCQGSDEIKISINPELSVDLGTDRSICKGSTTTLDAGNPGSTYLWNTGATTRTLEVTQAGTYSVVVTDPNGCQGSDEIKISINPQLSVDLGTDRSICKGSTTTLDAGNPGSTYLWNTGATTQTLEVTQAGTYSVVVTDPNGCQGSDEIKIIVNVLPEVDLGTDRSICKGSTTTLDAGNPGSTYLWNTGATTRTLEVTQAGTYSVVVTDPNGCQGSDEIKISINPELSVDLGTDRSICKGSTTTLDAGNPGSTYLWNTGATTRTLEVTQAGTYSVVVTDPNGCQGSDEIKISINPQLSVDLGTDRSICKGSTTTLDAGNPGSTYLWNTGATTQTLEVTQAGTYSVVVTDPNGCQGSDEIKISINPELSVDLGTDRSICKGSTTTLDAGNPGSTYLWNTGATTRTLEVTQAGTYSVVVTDPNGCQGSDEIKISINPELSVDLGTDRSICKGSTTTLDAGNPGSTYLWNTGATTRTLEVTQAGTYSVVVTDPNGCQGSDEIKIIVNVLPEVDLGTDRSICKGSTTTLDAGNPGSTYLWNTGATTQTLEVTQAGTYSVVVTDPNGCQGSDEIKISINPELSVDLGTDRSICKGSTTTLDAGNPGSTYLWNTGATTRTLEVTQAGTYSVVVIDPNGCQGSDEIKISINPELTVDLGTDRSICKGSTTTLDAGNPGSTYLWNTGATTQTLEVTQAGTYSVVVTDPNGCSSSSSIHINYYETPEIKEIKINGNDAEVYAIGKAPLEYSLDLINWQSSPFFTGLKPKIYNVYVRNALGCINGPLVFSILDIPNIITPNGDGVNDVWHIKGLEIYPGSSLTIFDRYGKLLLKQKIDKEFIWDGKYLGRNLPSSSYWYILDLTDGRRLTGWIAIRNHDSIR